MRQITFACQPSFEKFARASRREQFLQPMAIEAAMEAEHMHIETLNEQRRVVELKLVQACYEATLAERRYAACDPDNRLSAAQLEKSWESTLRRVEA
jgi:hypothetical protein